MKKQSYFRFRTNEGVCEMMLTLKPTESEGFEYYFLPHKNISEDLKKQFHRLKSNHARQHFYDNLGYPETRLHEGCIFGLKYAHHQYCTTKNICVEITQFDRSHGATHDLVAYVAVIVLVKLMAISPLELPYFSKERNRFIFPNVARFPVGHRTINDMIKIHSKEGLEKLETEIVSNYIIARIQKLEDDYFSR